MFDHKSISQKTTFDLYIDLINKITNLAELELKFGQHKLMSKMGLQKRQMILAAGIFVFVLLGFECVTCFVVLLLGDLFDGRYWLSSLMIGIAYLLIAVPTCVVFLRNSMYGKS